MAIEGAYQPRTNGLRPCAGSASHRLEADQRFKIEGVTPSNTFTDAYVLGHVMHRVMTSESSVGNRAV
jgi:hypothetical protein